MQGPNTPRRGSQQGELGLIENGAVAVRDGRIVLVGSTDEVLDQVTLTPNATVIDAEGRTVAPGLIDAHTHVVFGGTRELEFELRLKGASYQEIHQSGGGILSTVEATKQASQEELVETAEGYLSEMLRNGTTTAEAKSGYGLDLETEIKQLEAIKALNDRQPINLIPTYLGAHATPKGQTAADYTEWLCETAIPEIGTKGLARFCDVFCETGVFNVAQSEQILMTGLLYGMRAKLHADELTDIGGASLAARVGAISADHLLLANPDGLGAMAQAGCVAVLMPGTPVFLGLNEQAPARTMINLGLPVALGSDFNPGSCFISSMPLVMSLACTRLHMTPAEALVAATINAAWAIGEAAEIGSLEVGKRADIVMFDVPNYRQIPYRMGSTIVSTVIKDGRVAYQN